jgi:hypothetical protein
LPAYAPAARNWLDKNFEKNYKSKGGDWAASVKFGDLSKDEESNIKFSPQTNTAHGMIKAHKNAFEDGRYGFEFKKKSGCSGKVCGVQRARKAGDIS